MNRHERRAQGANFRRYKSGPVEEFRVLENTVAITLDVEGTAPSTCMIQAAKLTDIVADIDQLVASEHWDYCKAVRFIAQEFPKARRTDDDNAFQAVGLIAFWTFLRHPRAGETSREKLSDTLRLYGKAHITWQFGSGGLAMALADRFADLEGLAAGMPKDTVFTWAQSGDEPESGH